ncbi:MAG: hypothetical protein V3T70_09185 [Phycisphaerae bacterium]
MSRSIPKNRPYQGRLTMGQILAWADAHYRRSGAWPRANSGTIRGAGGMRWDSVRGGLRYGRFGLRGGSSLARLLHRRRGVPYGVRHVRGRKLTKKQVLAWSKAHYQRTRRWPRVNDGPVHGVADETWTGIDQCLRLGYRGVPGGSSLAKLLGKGRRSVRNLHSIRLTNREVLAWAEAHHRRTGFWPNATSGRIAGSEGELWGSVHNALKRGMRGLRGGTTLARFLVKHLRADISLPSKIRLTEKQILKWADAHHRRTGRWPKRISGPIRGSRGVTWDKINNALYDGCRGLPGGSSVARLLAKHRRVRHRHELPRLRESQILKWADEHYRRKGAWPHRHSGRVLGAPGETWSSIADAMFRGGRSTSGDVTLSQLLVEHRDARIEGHYPGLSEKKILLWAKAHYRRYEEWPQWYSGRVDDAPRETWKAINSALSKGHRGLPGGGSLVRLLAGRRRPRPIRI